MIVKIKEKNTKLNKAKKAHKIRIQHTKCSQHINACIQHTKHSQSAYQWSANNFFNDFSRSKHDQTEANAAKIKATGERQPETVNRK